MHPCQVYLKLQLLSILRCLLTDKQSTVQNWVGKEHTRLKCIMLFSVSFSLNKTPHRCNVPLGLSPVPLLSENHHFYLLANQKPCLQRISNAFKLFTSCFSGDGHKLKMCMNCRSNVDELSGVHNGDVNYTQAYMPSSLFKIYWLTLKD